MIGAPLLYVASFGPACWLTSRLGHGTDWLPFVYRPLLSLIMIDEGQERAQCAAYSWMEGRPERVPTVPSGRLARFSMLVAPAGWHWSYCAIYTIRPGTDEDARVRLRDEAWQWSDAP